MGGKRFGLLSNCDHVFCFECITTWRKTKNSSEVDTKNCPECRSPSDYVMPSTRYATGDYKTHLFDRFKSSRKLILCRFEKNGYNNCRNESSCLFKHTLPFRPQRHFERRPPHYSYISNANLILNVGTLLRMLSDETLRVVHEIRDSNL